MAIQPEDYQWSSYGIKTTGKPDLVVDLDHIYEALGSNKSERQKAYREYVLKTIPEEELKLIREALQRSQVTGGNRFREQLQKKHNIHLSHRGPGRPRKTEK
jgi:putative transposase